MQFDPHRGEDAAGGLDGDRVHVVGQDGYSVHHGQQRGDVAQAPVGLLEIGLEQEPEVPEGSVALGDLVGQFPEPRWLLADPALPGSLEHRLGDLGLATDHPPVEQAEGDAQVLSGHVERLGGAADTVVQRDPLVPHRVPDPVRRLRDVLATLVDQYDVEVAVGAQLATPEATDGQQGHPPSVAPGGLVEQAGQPLVGRCRVGPTEVVTLQVGLIDQLLTSGAQAHRGTVPPGRAGTGVHRGYAGSMADDSKGSGLSTTEVVLLVLGVLVVGWFLLGLVHLIFGLVWTLAKVAVVVVLVVVAVKFLFGRSKTS